MTSDERRVLEALERPVAVLSSDQDLVWASRRFGTVLGAESGHTNQIEQALRADVDLARAMAGAADALAAGARRAEFRWVRGGVERLVFRGSLSRLDDERTLVLLEDVTDQAEAETLFAEARDYLDRVLNQLPVGVIVFDATRRTTFFNRSQAELSARLGLPHALTEVIGAPVSDVYPVLGTEAWGEIIATVMSNGESAIQDRLPYPASDPTCHLHLQLYPLQDRQGSAGSLVCVTQDVSRLVELEQDLVKKERLAVAGQLVATFHHEINNPLVSILGMAEMLLYKSSLNEELTTRVERIRNGALRIAEVTKKMREIRELGRHEWPQHLPTLADQVMRPSA